ncbi:unnamed protein product, partial [Prorocentrum cordatum]
PRGPEGHVGSPDCRENPEMFRAWGTLPADPRCRRGGARRGRRCAAVVRGRRPRGHLVGHARRPRAAGGRLGAAAGHGLRQLAAGGVDADRARGAPGGRGEGQHLRDRRALRLHRPLLVRALGARGGHMGAAAQHADREERPRHDAAPGLAVCHGGHGAAGLPPRRLRVLRPRFGQVAARPGHVEGALRACGRGADAGTVRCRGRLGQQPGGAGVRVFQHFRRSVDAAAPVAVALGTPERGHGGKQAVRCRVGGERASGDRILGPGGPWLGAASPGRAAPRLHRRGRGLPEALPAGLAPPRPGPPGVQERLPALRSSHWALGADAAHDGGALALPPLRGGRQPPRGRGEGAALRGQRRQQARPGQRRRLRRRRRLWARALRRGVVQVGSAAAAPVPRLPGGLRGPEVFLRTGVGEDGADGSHGARSAGGARISGEWP